MADPRNAGSGSARPPGKSPIDDQHAPDPMDVEKHQPDPMPQGGRLGGGGMSILALAIAALLAVVFYGLNGHNTAQNHLTTPPVASSSPSPAGNAATPHG